MWAGKAFFEQIEGKARGHGRGQKARIAQRRQPGGRTGKRRREALLAGGLAALELSPSELEDLPKGAPEKTVLALVVAPAHDGVVALGWTNCWRWGTIPA